MDVKLTLNIPDDTERGLRALAQVAGRTIEEIAQTELAGVTAFKENPEALLNVLLWVYCEAPEDHAIAAARFSEYCRRSGIRFPAHVIDTRLAEALEEIDHDQAELLISAGELLSRSTLPRWRFRGAQE